MTYTFFDFLKLIGYLGLFLYGMKMMSEGLQKIAGDKLRTLLSAMTSNRFSGILTGMLITCLIQSSSATTVMVVSFVNAGLLTLVQAFGVIMGANIGTTATAWIISLFGFKIDISIFALPLMAVTIPLIFSKNNTRKSLGEFVFGFSFLFLGLQGLKNSTPDLGSHPEVLEFVRNYASMGFGSIVIFVIIGTILTMVVQSSSATMAITLIMCANGWINVEQGAAMVLGENIGTTITAILASLSGNISAKRAAFSHFVFNIFGVIWAILFFKPFMALVQLVVGALFGVDSAAPANTPFTLSMFHSMFNIINVLILIWFSRQIVNLAIRIIKKRKPTRQDEEFHLTYIASGLMSTAELSLVQANKETVIYAERTGKMFILVRDLYHENDSVNQVQKFSRIEKYESISDRIEVEIAKYLTKVLDGRLSDRSKFQIQTLLRVVSEIESVADACYNIARIIMRKNNDDKAIYTPEMNKNIELMMDLVEKALNHMIESMRAPISIRDDFNQAINYEHEINNFRNRLKTQNVSDLKGLKYNYQTSVTYMDIIVECERTGDYIINVADALKEAAQNT